MPGSSLARWDLASPALAPVFSEENYPRRCPNRSARWKCIGWRDRAVSLGCGGTTLACAEPEFRPQDDETYSECTISQVRSRNQAVGVWGSASRRLALAGGGPRVRRSARRCLPSPEYLSELLNWTAMRQPRAVLGRGLYCGTQEAPAKRGGFLVDPRQRTDGAIAPRRPKEYGICVRESKRGASRRTSCSIESYLPPRISPCGLPCVISS